MWIFPNFFQTCENKKKMWLTSPFCSASSMSAYLSNCTGVYLPGELPVKPDWRWKHLAFIGHPAMKPASKTSLQISLFPKPNFVFSVEVLTNWLLREIFENASMTTNLPKLQIFSRTIAAFANGRDPNLNVDQSVGNLPILSPDTVVGASPALPAL